MVTSIAVTFLTLSSRASTASEFLAGESWECSPEFWTSATSPALTRSGLELEIDREFLNAEPCNERGDSVAHMAAKYVQNPGAMGPLVLWGADLEATNIHGDTVWDYATENQYDPEGVLQAMESAVALLETPVTPSEQGDQADSDSSGDETKHPYYFSLNMGLAHANQVSSSLDMYTIPSYCDPNLYIDPAQVPDYAVCSHDVVISTRTSDFSPSMGPAFGAKVGRRLGDSPVRVEFEYRNRRHGDDQGLLVKEFNPINSEWSNSVPPRDRLSHYRAHEFFGNIHYDFEMDSGPIDRFHLGVGAGVSRVSANYDRLLLRKTRAEGFHNLWGRPPLAAGTLSMLEHDGNANRFIGQVVGDLSAMSASELVLASMPIGPTWREELRAMISSIAPTVAMSP